MNDIPQPPAGPNILRELTWPIDYRQGEEGYLTVLTDAVTRTHTIFLPAQDSIAGPLRWIEVQHEAAHCLLAERCHHLFSISKFRGGGQDFVASLTPIFNTATDWFTDELLFLRWPEVMRSEVIEHLRAMPPSAMQTPEQAWGVVFLLAQAQRYRCSQARKRALKILPPEITKIVDFFLATDPSKPRVTDLQRLINSMLRVAIDGELSVSLVDDGGLEVWEFT